MLTCPKCSKTFDGGSKICRDCGAILQQWAEPQAEPPHDEVMEAALKEDQEEPPQVEWERTPWQCPHCKEAIEANFDACWNCGTQRDGKPVPGFVSERSESEPMGSRESERHRRNAPNGEPCPRCGSKRVIPNAVIGDQGQYSDGKLKALVIGNPEAWIFKDVERSEVKADICGECGHIELRVTNPGLLYEHYLRSLEST